MSYKSNTKKQKRTGGKMSGQPSPGSMYGILNGFFERHRRTFFWLAMILSVLMCIFMFDVKVTQSGDDCDYIIAADDFWRHFTFPTYHGPLYPIVLSPFAGIFGMNLILFKSLSSIFILLSIWLFYKGFQGGGVPDV
ncbi:MAG: hypothetical protein LBB90_05505, partial [Tannerella sp.]|nr:hypothetical protein [Tannerella sp.]